MSVSVDNKFVRRVSLLPVGRRVVTVDNARQIRNDLIDVTWDRFERQAREGFLFLGILPDDHPSVRGEQLQKWWAVRADSSLKQDLALILDGKTIGEFEFVYFPDGGLPRDTAAVLVKMLPRSIRTTVAAGKSSAIGWMLAKEALVPDAISEFQRRHMAFSSPPITEPSEIDRRIDYLKRERYFAIYGGPTGVSTSPRSVSLQRLDAEIAKLEQLRFDHAAKSKSCIVGIDVGVGESETAIAVVDRKTSTTQYVGSFVAYQQARMRERAMLMAAETKMAEAFMMDKQAEKVARDFFRS